MQQQQKMDYPQKEPQCHFFENQPRHDATLTQVEAQPQKECAPGQRGVSAGLLQALRGVHQLGGCGGRQLRQLWRICVGQAEQLVAQVLAVIVVQSRWLRQLQCITQKSSALAQVSDRFHRCRAGCS